MARSVNRTDIRNQNMWTAFFRTVGISSSCRNARPVPTMTSASKGNLYKKSVQMKVLKVSSSVELARRSVRAAQSYMSVRMRCDGTVMWQTP